jgi:uncharacterized protein
MLERAWLRPPLLILTCLLPAAAHAAGFDCAKAAAPTETAICQDPRLSSLDDAMITIYKYAAARLGSVAEGQGIPQLEADQRSWLRKREKCGAVRTCIMHATERRLSVLQFHPDEGEPSPYDLFIGIFTTTGTQRDMNVLIMRLEDGALVKVSGGEPTEGRWLCDFVGAATLEGGKLHAQDARDAEIGLTLELTRDGVVVSETTDATNERSCGYRGWMGGSYRRTGP